MSGDGDGANLGSLPGRGLRLDGQRALVTGAGRGIGLACAEGLAAAGAAVTLLSRTRSELEEAAAEYRDRWAAGPTCWSATARTPMRSPR